MSDGLKEEIKKIEKEEAKLAKMKAKLEAEIKKVQEKDKKLEGFMQKSGFKDPRALVKALIAKYNLRGFGAASAAGKVKKKGERRKRTKVTAKLRDDIRKSVKAGTSMNQASKDFNISYAVVQKVTAGKYDNL